MGIRIDEAEGALVDDNFFVLDTWSVWTTTGAPPGPGYAPPFFKNNTFFIQHIWAFHITGAWDYLKLRNNVFGEYVRSKWGHQYLNIWSANTKIDSDYNFFWWHNDKQGKPEVCAVAQWHNKRGQ